VHHGSQIPFGVLSKTSFLLATVFGRAAIDDSVDEQQRFSVRRFFVGVLVLLIDDELAALSHPSLR